MIHVLALILSTCANVPPQGQVTDTDAHADRDCGCVGQVDVRIDASLEMWPPLLACPEARTLARDHFSVPAPWTLIFTAAGPQAFDDNALTFAYVLGVTYTGRRRTVIHAGGTDRLDHELCHVLAHEQHVTDNCDKARVRY